MYRRELLLSLLLPKKSEDPLPEILDWLKEARYIHLAWVRRLKKGEVKKEIQNLIGDLEWHNSWIRRYSTAIVELEKMERSKK